MSMKVKDMQHNKCYYYKWEEVVKSKETSKRWVADCKSASNSFHNIGSKVRNSTNQVSDDGSSSERYLASGKNIA